MNLTATQIEVGQVYAGTVLKLLDFGAIVSLRPGRDGLLHISQIANERVNAVSDYLQEGQTVNVKVIETDEKQRLRLSMKAVTSVDNIIGRITEAAMNSMDRNDQLAARSDAREHNSSSNIRSATNDAAGNGASAQTNADGIHHMQAGWAEVMQSHVARLDDNLVNPVRAEIAAMRAKTDTKKALAESAMASANGTMSEVKRTLAEVQTRLDTQRTEFNDILRSADQHLHSLKIDKPFVDSPDIPAVDISGMPAMVSDAKQFHSLLLSKKSFNSSKFTTPYKWMFGIFGVITLSFSGSIIAGVITGGAVAGTAWWFNTESEKNSFQKEVVKLYSSLAIQINKGLRSIDAILEKASKDADAKLATANVNYNAALSDKAAVMSNHAAVMADLRSKVESEIDRERTVLTQVTNDIGIVAGTWDRLVWQRWIPVAIPHNAVRLGKVSLADRELLTLLQVGGLQLESPALLPFGPGNSLLFHYQGVRRADAVLAVQNLMLRLLATVPPGQVHFTLLDPIGHGQTFASFMKLADYDDSLISGQIWTEAKHIEKQLVDLTEHMEKVIQKYLRNDFATIEDYNKDAGEIAEPYRVLVVADFPVNFSESMARRLASIAQHGPRCGVYVFDLMDAAKELPHGLREHSKGVSPGREDKFQDIPFEIRNGSTIISFPREGGVYCKECASDSWRLDLDSAPPQALFDRVVEAVGGAAKDAQRVEVPFERISFPHALWWKGADDDKGVKIDSRDCIKVALGPSGARKVQFFELGRGIAHHGLIVGRTGSGKSTLLHALITNIALTYHPSEIELYLIDFKEGVEFKTYATHALPHARVIAIESDREFGLSVLQGLQQKHKERGELFRANEVQNIAGYRNKTNKKLPRILLLVDEFQGFFTEDDQIASQSRQILDMLARQGRAAGIHILLGSQTLTGDMLSRSTSEQIGVRIALQCSEVASRQIFAEDNPGARHLTRPGEAIYNAANGAIEGNNTFQVAWLPKEQHDNYLDQLNEFAVAESFERQEPLIVFEGNAPSDISKNRHLTGIIVNQKWNLPPRGLPVWLGEPIAIRAPTVAQFSRQAASNLLMLGQNEEFALAQLIAILVGLAAQSPVASNEEATTNFYVLDFGSADGANAGFLEKVPNLFPQPTRVAKGRQASAIIEMLANEVDARLKTEQSGRPARYLFIFGLQRARDIRQEEGYSSSREDPRVDTPKQFTKILRDGPDMGVHVIAWCDTLSNLNRTLDRRSMREFAMRIAFQMPAQDSSQFLDSQIASKLGPFRAVFQNEDEGKTERYRPYGLPTQAYLEMVSRRLKAKQL